MVINAKPFFEALLYADIFDYPLTSAELWRYAIGKHSEKDFSDTLSSLPPYLSFKEGYYMLKGREEIIKKRKQREKSSLKKILIAQKVAAHLSIFPTVLFIGISGSVAMKNADKDADIDLFIICKKNTVWQTRFCITILLYMLGLRRKRNEKKSKNKICTNMFVDEKGMRFAKSRQDLFTAHEISQMMPVIDKDSTYRRFLQANAWAKKFLPNALESGRIAKYVHDSSWSLFPTGSTFEMLAKFVQLWYMRKHKTVETVGDTMLAFHPVDYRKHTLKRMDHKKLLYEV